MKSLNPSRISFVINKFYALYSILAIIFLILIILGSANFANGMDNYSYYQSRGEGAKWQKIIIHTAVWGLITIFFYFLGFTREIKNNKWARVVVGLLQGLGILFLFPKAIILIGIATLFTTLVWYDSFVIQVKNT
jgi:hypothetical protein